MNGFADHRLDESAFGEKKGFTEGLRTFDAFPKTKQTYSLPSRRGGQITALLLTISLLLSLTELRQWWRGQTTQTFSVEKGVSHDLQINLDIVVAMRCPDLHINVQDASGDRILAADMLKRDPTDWEQWSDGRKIHRLHSPGEMETIGEAEDEEMHVHDVIAQGRKKRKFRKTPRLRGEGKSCRIYGSLEGNKVQGDFHITARGHGYMEFGQHLDHSAFNFSHIVTELSFGPFYPSLTNPLDDTLATTPAHFFKYQYYLSVVPTIYTRNPSSSTKTYAPTGNNNLNPHEPGADFRQPDKNTIFTNQYALTQHPHIVGERDIPGIFFKFDIEPILLIISEERGGLLALVVRLVNVLSGVLVGGGWVYQLWGWAGEVLGRRRKGRSEGVLHGRAATVEDAHDD